MTRRHARIALLLASLGSLAAGCEPTRHSEDSNTNFLAACVADQDCPVGASCLCGVCSVDCAASADCSELPGTLCSTRARLASSCSLPADSAGACLPRCVTGEPCSLRGGQGYCLNGACVGRIPRQDGTGGAQGSAGGSAGTSAGAGSGAVAGAGGAGAAGAAASGGAAGSAGTGGVGASGGISGQGAAGSQGGPLKDDCTCAPCQLALEKCYQAPAGEPIAICAATHDCHGETCYRVEDADGGVPQSGPCRVEISDSADGYAAFLGADACVLQNGCGGHVLDHLQTCVIGL